jgi:hypothetical protein
MQRIENPPRYKIPPTAKKEGFFQGGKLTFLLAAKKVFLSIAVRIDHAG